MPEVLEREEIAPKIVRFRVYEPELAAKRQPGQFLILRPTATSERIPLSIADTSAEAGWVELVVQEVGKASAEMCALQVGDNIPDVVGPLGMPTHVALHGRVVCIGGGVGIAPLYPIARAMKEVGNEVVVILGARTKDLIIFEDRMSALADELIVTTDDGSAGRKGLVTNVLQELIEGEKAPDFAIAVGPPIMMKFVCETTRPFNIPTWVSLNTLMVDGTGMCGGCRVTVGGQSKYVCVDGPEFNGHEVDFDEMIRRLAMYKEFERRAYERFRNSSDESGGEGCRVGLDR